MNQFTKWANKEYSLAQRLFALLIAGALFVFIIPYTLILLVPKMDAYFNIPTLFFGIVNLIIGLLFMVIGAFYGFWSIISQLFKANGTPLPFMPTQKLLVIGPFKQCRNPMTFGTILLYLGIGILIGSLSSIVVVLLFAGLLLTYIKRIEERELAVRFGQEYLDYKAVTPFIIPRLKPRK